MNIRASCILLVLKKYLQILSDQENYLTKKKKIIHSFNHSSNKKFHVQASCSMFDSTHRVMITWLYTLIQSATWIVSLKIKDYKGNLGYGAFRMLCWIRQNAKTYAIFWRWDVYIWWNITQSWKKHEILPLQEQEWTWMVQC